MAILQPFVPLGNSGTLHQFPLVHPWVGGGFKQNTVFCDVFGPLMLKKVILRAVSSYSLTWAGGGL